MIQPRILEVRTKILKKNDELARQMRAEFQRNGTLVINLVSSPGTGKTVLLQDTLRQMVEGGLAVAAVVGDLETDNDAVRLSQSGAPVRQIMTHGLCHLEADMVQQHLADWRVEELEFLFIENVGNLVCPSSWDLGESIRVALLSVTEGEDKPQKYPNLFNTSDIAIITKIDLSEACEFNRQAALDNLSSVRPGIRVFETSAKKGTGMEEWIDYLKSMRAQLVENAASAL
jgi:hydrogenase nickel incorporation protein HypB